MEPIILRVSAFKIVFDDPANMVAVTIIRTWGVL